MRQSRGTGDGGGWEPGLPGGCGGLAPGQAGRLPASRTAPWAPGRRARAESSTDDRHLRCLCRAALPAAAGAASRGAGAWAGALWPPQLATGAGTRRDPGKRLHSEQEWPGASQAWGGLLLSPAPHVGGGWGARRAPPGGGCLPGLSALLLAALPIFTAFLGGRPGLWPVCGPVGAALMAREWGCAQGPRPGLAGSLAGPSWPVGAACWTRGAPPC